MDHIIGILEVSPELIALILCLCAINP